MVKTSYADITPLLEEENYQCYYDKAPLFRRKKADTLASPLKKAQSIGVWSLWNQMKEEFSLDQSVPYNFSHSGKYVLCSAEIEKTPGIKLGCDIQEIAGYNLAFVKRFFTAKERVDIEAQTTEPEQIDRFYRYWVLKESFMKATGQGIAVDTRSFEIVLGTKGETSLFSRKPPRFDDAYYFYEFDFPDVNYKAACCTTDPHVDLLLKKKVL